MAETDQIAEDGAEAAPKKKSKLPLILGLVLALAGGGGGYYAVTSGLILSGESHEDAAHSEGGHDDAVAGEMPDIAFVALDPLVISLGLGNSSQHLRFRAQLEVPAKRQPEVEKLLPRVIDVLNSYLRALEVEDLADAAALVRLRAQMLRRVQVVTGAGRVNDLLIMEFVLN